MTGILDDSLIYLLHRASQVVEAHYAREQNSIGITARQFVVMAAIDADKNQSQTQLVDRSGIDRSTMADLIARLEEHGLLQKRRSKADARAFRIRLTPLGQERLQEAMALAASADIIATKQLSVCHRADFTIALKQIIATLAPEKD